MQLSEAKSLLVNPVHPNISMISSTVHVHKHREANINKNISRTFPATMPRLGTNKKDIILYNFA